MKLLLDVKDSKVPFLTELLRNFSFVKTKPLTPYAAEVLQQLQEAVDEVNLVKAGKKKPVPLKEFLDEIQG